MNVSLNWAQDNSNVDITSIGADSIVKKIGEQLGAVESVNYWGAKYNGIVVAMVVECEKHPDADKLSVCLIDDGGAVENVERNENGLVRVVCGAPNVRVGLTVAWLPPGVTVPSTANDAEPFILGTRELRGIKSNGMLASANELAISENHDGLLEITADSVGEENIKPGTPFKNLYGLDDTVIDCENKMFTHRPDCFGILGLARELAGTQNLKFVSPDWYLNSPEFIETTELPLEVQVDTSLVPRFMAVAISNITIAPSPTYIQATLSKVGIRPINNIVDITNWLMYLTAQPIHAYDYDKVKALSNGAPKLIARNSKSGELLKLLNDKEIKLIDDSSIIISTESDAVGMGGVMGGANTEVDSSTKNIILEIASFDMYNIRKTAMKYGLFTDGVTRFNKGQSHLQNDRVMSKALELVYELSGGQQASNIIDIKSKELNLKPKFSVKAEFINSRLGSDLSLESIKSILENVEIGIEIDDSNLIIQPPFWRMDLELPEDIVEEVGRLYGYDKLPVELPKRVMNPTQTDSLIDLKNIIREHLASNGANELMTYSFVHGDLLNKVGQNSELALELGNAISPSLQFYRISVLPNLLEKIHPNIKAGYEEFSLFEMGKVHSKKYIGEDGLPIEQERLALVFSANSKKAKNYSGSAYFIAKNYLNSLANKLGLGLKFVSFDSLSTSSFDQQIATSFSPKRSAVALTLDNQFVGVIGEFKPEVSSGLKLPEYTAGFELDIKALLNNFKNQTNYRIQSKYPKVDQDITLKVDQDISYSELLTNFEMALGKLLPENTSASVVPLDIYQAEGENTKNISFRLSISSFNETLKAETVNSLLDSVAEEISVERI